MRPLLPVLLAAPLAVAAAPLGADLAADVVFPLAPAFAQQLDATSAAEAAFIRRGKLKKRPSYSPKIVVVTWDTTADDSSDDTATVEVGFPTAAGGGIPDQTITQGKRKKAHFKGIITQYPATYSFTVELDDGSTVSSEVAGLDPSVAGSEVTVTLGSGFRARLRATSNPGVVRAVVSHDDKFWDPSQIAQVRFSDDTTTDVLPHVGTSTRWTKNLTAAETPPGFDTGSSYTIATTIKAADGTVLDTQTQSQVLGDDPVGAALERSRVTADANGNLQVITYADGIAADIGSLQVEVTDDAGTTLLSALDDMPAATATLWTYDTLTFEDPASAADEVYSVVLDAFDAGGNVLGSADVEVIVDGLSVAGGEVDPTPHPFTMVIADVETAGVVTLRQLDASNFRVGVGIVGDNVDRVDVNLFAISGPAAIPENLSMDVADDQWRGWKSVGDVGIGTLDGAGTATLDLVLLDEAGMEIGLVSSQVSDLPDLAFKRGGINGSKERLVVKALLQDTLD